MTDRELLEKAAKAAGIVVIRSRLDDPLQRDMLIDRRHEMQPCGWNPLTDDGDALRLAVKLKLLVSVCPYHTEVRWYDEALSETHTIEQWDNGMTPDEWTRRAIVRAAAAIADAAA